MLSRKLQAIVLICFGFSSVGWGYIPRAHLILEKTAHNHGSGAYQVIQEVHIPLEQDLLMAREYWTIIDSETMYVYIEGLRGWKDSLRLAMVYKGKNKYWINETGEVEKAPISSDFFEPFFHFRTARGIAELLIENKMAPRNVLAELSTPRNLHNAHYEPQSFLKLERYNHQITYAFASSAAQEGKENFPGLWVEQDSFQVLRVRFPSSADIAAEEYATFPGSLHLPKTRVLRWDDSRANVQLVKVARLGHNSRTAKDKTEPSYLRDLAQKRKITARWPDNGRVREFFKRFR